MSLMLIVSKNNKWCYCTGKQISMSAKKVDEMLEKDIVPKMYKKYENEVELVLLEAEQWRMWCGLHCFSVYVIN